MSYLQLKSCLDQLITLSPQELSILSLAIKEIEKEQLINSEKDDQMIQKDKQTINEWQETIKDQQDLIQKQQDIIKKQQENNEKEKIMDRENKENPKLEQKYTLDLFLNKNIDHTEEWIQTIQTIIDSVTNSGKYPGVNILSKIIRESFNISIPGKWINDWLKDKGILGEYISADGKKRTKVTDKSLDYGIYTERRSFASGPYDAILFTPKGVQFILKHIRDILLFKKK